MISDGMRACFRILSAIGLPVLRSRPASNSTCNEISMTFSPIDVLKPQFWVFVKAISGKIPLQLMDPRLGKLYFTRQRYAVSVNSVGNRNVM